MIRSRYLHKSIIALVALLLAFVAVLYTAQAREEVEPVQVSANGSSIQPADVGGFGWEIVVYPSARTNSIITAKRLWLVDNDGKKIQGTREAYLIDCEKRGVESGKDVFVDVEKNVIKFTGAYLSCLENPAHFEDFQDKVNEEFGDLGIFDSCEEHCTVPVDALFVDAWVTPDEDVHYGYLLEYLGFADQKFVVALNREYVVWAFSHTPKWIEIDLGDQLSTLNMDMLCSSGECTMQYGVNGVEYDGEDHVPHNVSHKLEENRFFIGNDFYGELRYLRFDPLSCGACFN